MKTLPPIGARVVLSKKAVAFIGKRRAMARNYDAVGEVVDHVHVKRDAAAAVKAVVQWKRPDYTEHLLPEYLELVS